MPCINLSEYWTSVNLLGENHFLVYFKETTEPNMQIYQKHQLFSSVITLIGHEEQPCELQLHLLTALAINF